MDKPFEASDYTGAIKRNLSAVEVAAAYDV